jgi:hypothetical protein
VCPYFDAQLHRLHTLASAPRRAPGEHRSIRRFAVAPTHPKRPPSRRAARRSSTVHRPGASVTCTHFESVQLHYPPIQTKNHCDTLVIAADWSNIEASGYAINTGGIDLALGGTNIADDGFVVAGVCFAISRG